MADRSLLRHMMRGMCHLPHVGDHPGIPVAILFLGIGAAVGAGRDGPIGALIGLGFTGIWIIPILLVGAVSRSRLSDRMTKTRR